MNQEPKPLGPDEDIKVDIREVAPNPVFHQHQEIFSDEFLNALNRRQLFYLRFFVREFLATKKSMYKMEIEIEDDRAAIQRQRDQLKREILDEQKKFDFEKLKLDSERRKLDDENRTLRLEKERIERDDKWNQKWELALDKQEKVIEANAKQNQTDENRLKLEYIKYEAARGELQLRWNEYNHIKENLDKDIRKLKKNQEKEFQRRLNDEKRERQREKNKFAAEKVTEALMQRNKEVEQEITKLVEVKVEERLKRAELERINDHEASTAISVVVEQEVANKAKKDRLALLTKASVFSGEDREPRCEEMSCTICHVRESAVVYEPCMHVATCIDCVPRNYLLVTDRCQMCREKITDFKRVFFTAADLPD